MSNPFDTYPSVIVGELKETRQRLEHQMVKYAVFKKVGWDVTECGATSRSDDVLAFARSDDDGFRLRFWDTDHEFRNVSAEDAACEGGGARLDELKVAFIPKLHLKDTPISEGCRGHIQTAVARKSIPQRVRIHQPICRTFVEFIDLVIPRSKFSRDQCISPMVQLFD